MRGFTGRMNGQDTWGYLPGISSARNMEEKTTMSREGYKVTIYSGKTQVSEPESKRMFKNKVVYV